MMAVGFVLFILSWLGIAIFTNVRNRKVVDYLLLVTWFIGLLLMVLSLAVFLWKYLP